MKISEIINLRRSCRTFNGLHLDKSVISKLLVDIESLPRLFDNVEPPIIKFVNKDLVGGSLGTYGVITGARQFLVMASKPGVKEQLQAGFMFEALLLKATAMGLSTCWLGGTFNRGAFAEAVGIDAGGRKVSIVSPLGHSTSKRRFAERMMRRVVKADRRKPFDRLFKGVDRNTPLGRVMQAVRLAPSSTNSQPWRAAVSSEINSETDSTQTVVKFECMTDKRFSAIDMGIAYCHFLLASEEENLRWKIEETSNPLALVFRSC